MILHTFVPVDWHWLNEYTLSKYPIEIQKIPFIQENLVCACFAGADQLFLNIPLKIQLPHLNVFKNSRTVFLL